MRRFIILLIMLVTLVSPTAYCVENETDTGLSVPEDVAKQYVADKYDYDLDDLRTQDALIGRGAAVIDVVYGYNTERVVLIREGEDWKVETSATPERSKLQS
jgi:hypothetical protein